MADLKSNVTVTIDPECSHDDIDVQVTVRRSGGGFILTQRATCRKCSAVGQFPSGKDKYTATPAIALFFDRETAVPPPRVPKKSPKPEPDPSLAKSKINRAGLKAGAVAPDWTLPAIDGSEWSLSQFRGRRVLLVFSSPTCGPCDYIAPKLQAVHEANPDVAVVVISQKDMEAVRAKAEKFGLTHTIVVQKAWEVSKDYGIFATPVGYLIDENGVLLSDVAVGADPIINLAAIDAAEAKEKAQ